jgi:hypothetical protein
MLPDGRYAALSDIARAERIDRTYASDILMLTLLAPDIVEAILDGRHSAERGVQVLREGFPVAWREQRDFLGRTAARSPRPPRFSLAAADDSPIAIGCRGDKPPVNMALLARKVQDLPLRSTAIELQSNFRRRPAHMY